VTRQTKFCGFSSEIMKMVGARGFEASTPRPEPNVFVSISEEFCGFLGRVANA
jgi:hypothetical protein